MTRSNDPFEDLPEWKERRRLQEAQGLRQGGAGAAEQYSEAGYDAGAGYGAAREPGYHDGHPAEPAWGHATAPQAPEPAYDPTYHDYTRGDYQQAYAERAAAQPGEAYAGPGHDNWAAPGGFSEGPGGEAGWRNAPAPHYEEPRFGYQAEPAPALAASLDDYRPQAGGAEPPGFGAPPPYFGAEAPGDARYEAAGYDGEEDEYDEEYEYEDDEEEGRGYGWKLLAGVVVAGAVIAGGGVYLYDMLAGEAGGPAPIIKADRGPAKTAPTDPGGRSFANQDSKLLGRLDSGKPSSGRVALDDGERSRVREVPTVRVSPDGRLILPKEPQGAAAGGETASPAVPSIPGINIVDNLSGSGFGGGLPPVVAKATPTQPVTQAAAPSASQPTSSSPSAPIIRNRTAPASAPAGNLATVRAAAPPPVPQKSEISSAWRMTGATASVAQPARQVPSAAPATPTTTAATTGASTLGAASVARSAGRQYVAVIATKSSRMEALQSFAELQQRHPQALSNRVPSVQKADLSSRGLGTMYRLLVGPAGSRGAANEVCASLKAGGYSGCWVKAN